MRVPDPVDTSRDALLGEIDELCDLFYEQDYNNPDDDLERRITRCMDRLRKMRDRAEWEDQQRPHRRYGSVYDTLEEAL